MRITRLVLEGYRFLKLKNIRRFDYVPEKQTQIIVGTSGSGKSSVLKQLSPLPADKNDFYKPGKKEIWIEHNQKQYYLASLFTEERSMFIFEVDGENLNPGMTVTVYKELVESHFNYRADIHAILTGRVFFHDMDVGERRALFMRMNDDDYSYALAYFKKIKDRIKDYQLLLKQLQIRLGGEINKVIPLEKTEETRQQIQEERSILSKLLNGKRGSITKPQNMPADANSELMAAMLTLQSTLALVEARSGLKHPSESNKRLSKINEQLSQLNAEFNARCSSAERIRNTLNQINKTSDVNLTALQAELDTIQIREKEIDNALWYKTVISDVDAAENAFNKAYSAIEHYVPLLAKLYQKYPDSEYSWMNSAWAQLIDDIRQGETALLANEHALKEIDSKLAVLNENAKAGITECPSCSYQWRLNYSEAEHKRLTNLQEITLKQKEAIDTKLNALKAYKTDFDTYWLCLDFASSFYQTPALSEVLKEIDQKTPYLKDPVGFQSALSYLQQDFRLHREKQSILQRKSELITIRSAVSNSNQINRDSVKQSIADEETILQRIKQEITPLSDEKRALEANANLISSVLSAYQQMNQRITDRNTQYHEQIEVQLHAIENEVIHALQLSITSKDRMLSQALLQQQNIAALNAEIELIQKKLALLKIAAKELSPTEGLIAKGMTSFINCFVDGINTFINKVWLYPMEIIPITVKSDEDFDLDYKFAVSVNDDLENPTPDIADCSSGMKEIINIAFVVVIMDFLGLNGFPVFLDEFAVKMDEAHRKSAYQILEQLTDVLGVSQVFIVSHYETSYANLSNSDLTVLCDANITLPKHLTFNTCVTMN